MLSGWNGAWSSISFSGEPPIPIAHGTMSLEGTIRVKRFPTTPAVETISHNGELMACGKSIRMGEKRLRVGDLLRGRDVVDSVYAPIYLSKIDISTFRFCL